VDLLDEIETRVLCADGAMGTLLIARGITARCPEQLCLSDPETIAALHSDYLRAGARIIRTNSLAANAVRLAAHHLENHVNEINWQAAQIARRAVRGTNAHVAGCVGPLGLTAADAAARNINRKDVFRQQIGALLDGRADFILLESFEDLDELALAIEVKHELHHCPVIASLATGASGRLPAGISIAEAFERLAARDPDVMSINCVSGPHIQGLLKSLPAGHPIAVFIDEGPACENPPAHFAAAARNMAALGARIIGGGTGTTPEHIAALSDLQ